ncbi:MAG: hypothetical protein GX545_08465 [Fibrobacter sp.]|jgi:uncharacterized protein (TIGR02145 family)|nr:hypothetical protein [Fibrobacter sp.]
MPQKMILCLVVFGLFLNACDSKSKRDEEKNRHVFSMTKFVSWYGVQKNKTEQIPDASASLDTNSSIDTSLSNEVSLVDSSIVKSSSSTAKIEELQAKIDSFYIIVENTSGSGMYFIGDTVSLFPQDKLDSGLCFDEWEVSDSKYLITNDLSDTAKVVAVKDSLKVKAVYKSCYEGLESVVIGNLKWTTRNMNIWTFSGSWCYENKRKNCKRYGRLYDFETAQKVCRSGWRLPTDAEWNSLTQAAGNDPGTRLKSREGWIAEDGSTNSNGIDAIGFAGLPAGIFYEGNFLYEGVYAYYWTATESNASMAWFRSLSYDNNEVYRHSNYKQAAFSVRCVQDI